MSDNYSVAVKIRKDATNKNGTASIYLQVILNAKVARIGLGLSWPPNRFDLEKLCLKRNRDDKEASDYNMILRETVAKANDIFTTYRLMNKPLTIAQFKLEYKSNLRRDSFVRYMTEQVTSRYKNRNIAKQTFKNHQLTISKLVDAYKDVTFRDFDNRWAENFDGYLKRLGLHNNTRWTHHKHVKVYLERARNDSFTFVNPYERFHARLVEGRHQPLSKSDLGLLYEYYEDLQGDERIVLRKFIFMCFVGLRVSDLQGLHENQVVGDTLVTTPKKTKNTSGKMIQIPLSKKAKLLWEEEQKTAIEGFLFTRFKNNSTLRVLKRIANTIFQEHKKELTLNHQVARETFATIAAALMPLQVVQELLGHTKITTTRKYVKVDYEQKKKGIDKLDSLF